MKAFERSVLIFLTACLISLSLMSCAPRDPMATKSFKLELEKRQAVYIFEKLKDDSNYYFFIIDKYSSHVLIFIDEDADQKSDRVLMLSRSEGKLHEISRMVRKGSSESEMKTFLDADLYIQEGYQLMLQYYGEGEKNTSVEKGKSKK